MKQMKMRMAAMLLFLISVVSIQAQSWRNAPKYHFGACVGITSSTQEDCDALLAPTFGFKGDVKIAKLPFYLESGLYYENRGFKTDYWEGTTREERQDILLPLLLSYHIYVQDVVFQPFMGPAVSFSLDGESSTEAVLRLGCTFQFKKLYTSLIYDAGIRSYEPDDLMTTSLSAVIGINF